MGINISTFYSASNLAQQQKADLQIKQGEVITRSLEELEAMENE